MTLLSLRVEFLMPQLHAYLVLSLTLLAMTGLNVRQPVTPSPSSKPIEAPPDSVYASI